MPTYFTHGKLLLTGEYVVLDNALALAMPTKMGQHMQVDVIPSQPNNRHILWQALDSEGKEWFATKLEIRNRKVLSSDKEASHLVAIFNKAMDLNPDFLLEGSFSIETRLEFPTNWGLGSSSTLVCNLAKWAQVDAFQLSEASFGGSGYDIAVGMLGGDVIYRNADMWEGFVYNPPFKDRLYFVHLGEKQNSREGIKQYRSKPKNDQVIQKITAITEEVLFCKEFNRFQELLTAHEEQVSSLIELAPVKEKLFNDYPFAIKSLGAWGGDFVLACGNQESPSYFKSKGFGTIRPFDEMVK